MATGSTVSVYIPTIPKHYHYLDDIVKEYNSGKIVPDEIVIGPTSDYYNNELLKLELNIYENVTILPCEKNLEAGPNRQRAKEHTHGDIIIYQDSDDMPYKDRVFWIKVLFEHFPDVWVINSSYKKMGEKIPDVLDATKVGIIYPEDLWKLYFPNNSYPDDVKDLKCYGTDIPFPVHAGAVCIRRQVLDHIKWRKMEEYGFMKPLPIESYKGAYAEDLEFCIDALWAFNKSIVVDLPLYYYRS